MQTTFCPKCGSTNLTYLGDGNYKCNKCGYIGSLTIPKDLFKT